MVAADTVQDKLVLCDGGTPYAEDMTVELPTGRLGIVAEIVTDPPGCVRVTVMFCALLGPRLITVIPTVMVVPGAAALGTLRVTERSAIELTGVAAVAVLLARLGSAVVVVTAPLKVWVVAEPAGTL